MIYLVLEYMYVYIKENKENVKIHVIKIVFSWVTRNKHQEILKDRLGKKKKRIIFVCLWKTDFQNPQKKLGLPLLLPGTLKGIYTNMH